MFEKDESGCGRRMFYGPLIVLVAKKSWCSRASRVLIYLRFLNQGILESKQYMLHVPGVACPIKVYQVLRVWWLGAILISEQVCLLCVPFILEMYYFPALRLCRLDHYIISVLECWCIHDIFIPNLLWLVQDRVPFVATCGIIALVRPPYLGTRSHIDLLDTPC